MNLNEFSRREAHEVRIGQTKIGSQHPIAVQSMTNTPTADTQKSLLITKYNGTHPSEHVPLL